MPEQVYRGAVLAGDDFEPVRGAVIVEDGVITAIEEDSSAPDLWICPAFFNAHTHLGDTVAMDFATCGDLEGLVTPPHGLKHRILGSTPRPRLIEGMRASIRSMQATGTAGFADFREGGADGVTALREAVQGEPILPLIFGREGGETIADGIGISSARDIPDTEEQVRRARAAGRLVAFHAGEKDPDDIDAALCYDPDLLVHCTHATRGQLRAIADAGVPVAVCIRSNWTLGVTCDAGRPPVREMAACGCTWYIGTDNVMFVQPDMLREMSFCETVTRMPPEEILRAAVGGVALAGRSFPIKKGNRANFIIIDPYRAGLGFSPDPVASTVKRVGERSILQTVIN